MKVIFTKRYELLDYAEQKGLFSIYDLLDSVHVKEGTLACTDGKTIYIDPEQFNVLSAEDQFFILSHELLHITYQHHKMDHVAFPNRELLNICQDIVINEYLVKKLKHRPGIGLFFDSIASILSMGGYTNGRITYRGILTTESLYSWLSRFIHVPEIKELLKGSLDIIPETGDEGVDVHSVQELATVLKIDRDTLKEENRSLSDDDIDDIISGGDGSGVTSEASSRMNKISMKEVIKYIKDFIGNNAVVRGRARTYTRPSRRFQSSEFILKGYKNTLNVKKMVIYLDTSGSMDSSFVNDMYNTLKVLHKSTKFELFTFDEYVHEVDFSTNYLVTGGGTDIDGVLKHIKENKNDVAIMITDCEDRFSLADVNSNLMIFTNDSRFKSDNKKVKVTYFE